MNQLIFCHKIKQKHVSPYLTGHQELGNVVLSTMDKYLAFMVFVNITKYTTGPTFDMPETLNDCEWIENVLTKSCNLEICDTGTAYFWK